MPVNLLETLFIDLFDILYRLLNDYRKRCCKEMNLPEARRAQLKFDDLKNKEMLRQL